ncbi:ABC transporter ATP-binding protein [Paraburkholderia nemoris]|uniref:ABC transporter ATP-binding protein n=1 Tax=Paraburkholderia TaxID=1822464 RepID=UPI001B0B84AA|nr:MULTISPECIES: ABC transporter ATP-binding protein [Paraburkholderia]MCX4137181.1 ABC transporter ATP-binding protein [Paraburkholderia aspalathi]MDN7169873.1 ABC transporter ATP-binding protein [Paraburkholderia sp. SEWSISQ10-3 4]MDQ6499512.1 ABC transporter ATP-binding protein [Paraburkholderia aspalathi]CAE6908951.1 Spermidine/putrescine import ATP-binding protein PotA [Paraburkholderia nemoris]
MQMNDASVSIHLRGLRQRFGEQTVLDGIDLDVPAGTTLALLGPSGCGKSTLLKLLAGLLRPDEGCVMFGGETVADPSHCVPPEARDLGMVFQDYALWPHMTVAGNVSFPLEMRGVPRAERIAAVAQALARVGLEQMAARRPSALSGGQQQRVALARAIVARPRVLLFDEPLSNLDTQLRATLCDDIRTVLAQLGTTAVYVTHDRSEADALAHTIVTLAQGRVAQTVHR